MRRTDRCGIALILVMTVFAMGLWACAPVSTQVPKRQPIFQKAEELSKLPPRVPKPVKKSGTVVPLAKDAAAPFGGILFTEERAMAAARLRIAYEELYDLAAINRRFTGVALRAADAQLAEADKEIARLRKANSSWWARNKLTVGIVIGTVLTLGLGGFAVWGASELRK